MPTYTYKCSECGIYDLSHSMQHVVSECPQCDGKSISKVFNNVGVQFKGSGFYSTDSKEK